MRELETRRQTLSEISHPVKLFISLASEEKHHQLAEFQHYLGLWKAEYINPLCRERRNLMEQLESSRIADQTESEQHQNQHRIDDIKRQLEEVSFHIDQLDISIDSFWTELMKLFFDTR